MADLLFPALCPWLTVTHFGRMTYATVTHGESSEYVRKFEMRDVSAHFQDFITEALKIKSELIKAEQVAKALNG